MIRSMTGFGRASFGVGGVAFEIETRSVNHRHLDVQFLLSVVQPAQFPQQISPLSEPVHGPRSDQILH